MTTGSGDSQSESPEPFFDDGIDPFAPPPVTAEPSGPYAPPPWAGQQPGYAAAAPDPAAPQALPPGYSTAPQWGPAYQGQQGWQGAPPPLYPPPQAYPPPPNQAPWQQGQPGQPGPPPNQAPWQQGQGQPPPWQANVPYGQPGYQPWGAMPQHKPMNGLAIASTVVAFCGLFTFGVLGIVGLILGIVSLRQIGARNQSGRGWAIAGIVVGSLMIVFGILAGVGLILEHTGNGTDNGGLNTVSLLYP